MKHFAFLAAILAAGSASAAPIRITLVDSMGAPVEYRQGRAGAMSSLVQTEAALVVDRATIDEKDAPSLRLGVKNKGRGPVNLTPENVSVTTEAGVDLPLYTQDEILAAIEADAVKREKRARFAARLDAMGAALRDEPTRPNPAVQGGVAEAQEQTQAALAYAAQRGFLAQTVRVGEEHMTDLGLGPLPKGVTSLTVKITLGEETHTFPLSVTR